MLPEGHTLAPIIIATDKTQLTQFSGSKAAYPIYLTLGNLPKSICRKPSKRACILLGYLSVDKISDDGISQREHTARYQRLFHESMRHILAPLKEAGRSGVEMTGGDGAVRMVHPILASYVADFPEQCLVTCTKNGTCPKCQVSAADLQDLKPSAPRNPEWTIHIIEEAKRTSTSTAKFHKACMQNEVSGSVYTPFWQGFPYTDIHMAVTPDVLHQLYQGVIKHLIEWCQRAMTEAELDQRIRCLPPAYGVRHFKNGISALSQISGTERKNMAKILLGCLVGVLPRQAITATRALLDFIYLAQYSTHDNTTLGYMTDALKLFHANRQYFIDVRIRDDFNIPKFHSLIHYVRSIQFFGTTDNYNTEMFERLHIDFAKKGWRASNSRDEFPQMITWLSRQEKVASFENYLSWLEAKRQPLQPPLARNSAGNPISIAKNPSHPSKSIVAIEKTHYALGFSDRLKEYLNSLLPNLTSTRRSHIYPLPFDRLDVFYLFKFHPVNLEDGEEECDVVKANPESPSGESGRFDTVIALHTEDAESTGVAGTHSSSVLLTYLINLFPRYPCWTCPRHLHST